MVVSIVGEPSSALDGSQVSGLPAGNYSGFQRKSASAFVALSKVGDSSSGL